MIIVMLFSIAVAVRQNFMVAVVPELIVNPTQLTWRVECSKCVGKKMFGLKIVSKLYTK